LALASAAALVIVGTLTLRTGSGVRDGDVTSPQPVHPDIVLSGPTSDKGGAGSEPKALHPVARSPKTARVQLDAPEVLIDPLLADAIRRLAVSTRNVLLDDAASARSLQPASDVPVPSVVVEPLTVPELVLKPADQNGGW